MSSFYVLLNVSWLIIQWISWAGKVDHDSDVKPAHRDLPFNPSTPGEVHMLKFTSSLLPQTTINWQEMKKKVIPRVTSRRVDQDKRCHQQIHLPKHRAQ